ncbi:MAG: GGDEF domain-containing protein, partial [Rhodocyclaceae bacterium]|nr:GGDEF domain-containing protein [Rhodocyclaceae bacterium]
RSQRTGEPLSLMIIDVDHFKLYNDHYGHVAGDAALSAVAGVLRAVCRRPADVVARYGGEEFAALLPNTSGAGAAQLAQHLLAELSRRNIPHAASLTAPYVTVSAGIASLPDATTDPPRCCTACSDDTARQIAHFVSSADAALYAAKRAGRAQAWVVDHGTSGEPRPAQFELAESPCLRQVNAA